MNDALVPLVRTLDLNTRLFLNALDGVDDKIATSRPNESTNHIAFVAAIWSARDTISVTPWVNGCYHVSARARFFPHWPTGFSETLFGPRRAKVLLIRGLGRDWSSPGSSCCTDVRS